MALLNRETLKNFFRKGSSPSEEHFSELIESTVNKLDDGFDKSTENGLSLAPQGKSSHLMSFFKSVLDEHPAWQIGLLNDEVAKGLTINNAEGLSAMFFQKEGPIGIQTLQPAHTLEVNGHIGTKGRVGTFFKGKVAGDGQWHNILVRLNGPQALEIVARIDGNPKSGKYAMSHAIAVSTYGKARNIIQHSNAYFGWFWNRLEWRWHGDVKDYSLQIRTRSKYGADAEGNPLMIKFHITQLWDEEQEFTTYDETQCQYDQQKETKKAI